MGQLLTFEIKLNSSINYCDQGKSKYVIESFITKGKGCQTT